MPGLNKLNYDNGYWPTSIQAVITPATLDFIEANLWLIALPQRRADYNVLADTRINPVSARKLSDATERCWQALLNADVHTWGECTRLCLEAQLEMYPNMMTPDVAAAIEAYRDQAYGWKVTGCGGGGYLLLISDRVIPNASKIKACRE